MAYVLKVDRKGHPWLMCRPREEGQVWMKAHVALHILHGIPYPHQGGLICSFCPGEEVEQALSSYEEQYEEEEEVEGEAPLCDDDPFARERYETLQDPSFMHLEHHARVLLQCRCGNIELVPLHVWDQEPEFTCTHCKLGS